MAGMPRDEGACFTSAKFLSPCFGQAELVEGQRRRANMMSSLQTIDSSLKWNDFSPLRLVQSQPFALSLSKGTSKVPSASSHFRSWFDKLTTNGS